MTLKDILHLVEKSVGRDSTALKGSLLGLGLSDYLEEFFTGITHDKNMARMAEYMDANMPQFDMQDFFQKFNLQHKENIGEYFGGKKLKEEELVFPIFSNYKMVSLD